MGPGVPAVVFQRHCRYTEEGAKEKGRLLWRSGVSGVKIVVEKVVVEEKRM